MNLTDDKQTDHAMEKCLCYSYSTSWLQSRD